MKIASLITATLFVIACLEVRAEPATSDDADTAWTQLKQAAILPKPPATYTQEEIQQYYRKVAAAAETAADRARAFDARFPGSPHALDAKVIECRMFRTAFLQGGRVQDDFDGWVKAENALLANPGLSETNRFEARVELAQSKRLDPREDWTVAERNAREARYEAALRQLIKDYPQKDQPYEMLLIYAAESPDNKARTIANEIMAEPAPDTAKEKAEAILRRLDGTGKPLDIQFTALDGRTIDLSKMKGKVVLLDFWATWCGPCVGEIPHVKEVYEKYHSKGFEVVGISFDEDKERLTQFVQSHEMPWPQYFDGKGWQNKFGQEFAIDLIPAMWLVDKNGNLQTENARDDLQGKVERLLEQN